MARSVVRWFGALLLVGVPSLVSTAAAQRPLAVSIDSTPPGATVIIDGATNEPLGTTPLKGVNVTKGPHTLLFQLTGYEDAQVSINVTTAGATFEGTLIAKPTLSVTAADASAEGAAVRIDGEPAGQVPLRVSVSVGRHLVQVGREGYQVFSAWVSTTAGAPSTVSVHLEPVAPDTGSILVAGDVPGSSVYLDGEPKGVTPTVLENVTPGEHSVEIRPQGFPPFRQAVRVVAKERATVSPVFNAIAAGASLRIIANVPDAQIAVDGEVVGTAPAAKEHLRAGEHIVSASAPGYAPAEQTVVLAENQQRVVSIRLDAVGSPEGRIRINATPATATIRVDEEDLGHSPAILDGAEPGTHVVIVTADGYEDFRTTCETGPGKGCELDVDLKVVGTPVRIETNVDGAELYLDGASMGPVPWEGRLPIGSHKLEVRAKGYRTHAEQVDLAPSSKVRTFDVELTPGEDAVPADGPSDAELDAAAATALTHSAQTLPSQVAAVDVSGGYPYLLEARMGVGILDYLDAGFAVRSFFRLNEFELRAKFSQRPSKQFSFGAQVRFGGGIGASGDPVAVEGANAADHPVNAFFMSVEGLGTLHFSDHGALTLVAALDMHSDRYDFTGGDSSKLSQRGLLGDRQDVTRFRIGGILELVVDRDWNLFAELDGVLIGQSRDILGDVLGLGGTDANLYFRLGATYKF
ncbi:MAG: PEGA domain-containing protein [Polyangiales bacterium]|nr:PEGA domain-containing protein [Myxococcales bacterium]